MSEDPLRCRIVERPAIVLIDDTIRAIEFSRPATGWRSRTGDGVLDSRLVHILAFEGLALRVVLLLVDVERVDRLAGLQHLDQGADATRYTPDEDARDAG